MGIGTGVGLVLAGAILHWAVDVDIPVVLDGPLGVILMGTGVVAVGATLAAAHLGASERTQTTVRTGLLLAVVGSLLAWAVEIDLPYVFDESLGLIFLFAGVVTIVVALAMEYQQVQARGGRPARSARSPRSSHPSHMVERRYPQDPSGRY